MPMDQYNERRMLKIRDDSYIRPPLLLDVNKHFYVHVLILLHVILLYEQN